ncbi:MAG: D-alanyl-D-alanine carboxypeptidase [Candidatus Melainabacteria bacterium]|nr:D-alanyl-D-alanine carboxypeptidase [Candidatus Melainabacteria bacterium]
MSFKRKQRVAIFAILFVAIIFCVFNNVLLKPTSAADAASVSQGKVATERVNPNSSLDNLVRVWLRIPALEHSNVGLEIMELPSGRVLYSFNGNRRYTPASTVKAITTACAFDLLSGAYTYKDSIVAEGTFSGSTLNGNLVVVPSQNPTFTRSQLQNLVKDAVQATARIPGAGTISDITGQVKLRLPPATEMGFHQSWLIEDWGRHWMPVSSNLVLDHNLASPAELTDNYRVVDAANTHGSLFNTLLNAPDGPCWLFMDRGSRVALTYKPKHPGAPKTPSFAEANPDEYNLALTEIMLRRHNVRISGRDVPLTTSDQVYPLAQHESIPLSQIIKTCLAESDNLYAQQLLRTIGLNSMKVETTAPGKAPEKQSSLSLEARGLLAMSRWLSKIGVPGQETILFDGCGLCRKDAVSPHALNMVLKHMAGENVDGSFLSLLRQNDESNVGKGNYRFKTGTMDSVRSISGVLTTAGKQNLAVTIMVNGHTPSIRNLKIAQAALINQLRSIKAIGTAYPKEPAGSATDPNVTVSAHENIVIDQAALKRSPKPAPRKARAAKRRR